MTEIASRDRRRALRHLPAAPVAVRPDRARPRQRRPADGRADPAAVRARRSATTCSRRSRTRRRVRLGGDNGVKAPRLAFTTDSFVVRPLFFPGGDIGRLAVHGTVNDLAVGGARPLFLSAAFILEEGLPLADLRRIVASMRAACDEAGVTLVTGDTKVVDRGKGDRSSSPPRASAWCPRAARSRSASARPGDRILVSGTIGDHGIAIMSVREGIEFETVLESDTRPADRPGPGDARRLPGDPLHARPDARRRVERPERAGRRPRASASRSTRRRSRSAPRSGAPARCSGSTRSTSPTRES